MDIGVYLRPEVTYDKMLELAKRADELGYFGAFLNDHVHGFGNGGREAYMEAWTAMTGLGVQTKNLRVGQIVLFNSLRNPAYLAKSVTTLDQMTKGRYEFLIGSGWNEPEYKGYDLMEQGRGMPSAKVRVDRFEESLKILNLMLTQEETSYEGKFWKLDKAFNVPQPLQQPMRISVGCHGPRMMRITALYAQGLNTSRRTMTELKSAIDQFEGIVHKYTDKKLSDYYISGFSSLSIIDDESKLKETIADRLKRMNSSMTIEKYREEAFAGTTEEIRTKISLLQDWGMEMSVASISVDGSDDPLKYFKDEVINKI